MLNLQGPGFRPQRCSASPFVRWYSGSFPAVSVSFTSHTVSLKCLSEVLKEVFFITFYVISYTLPRHILNFPPTAFSLRLFPPQSEKENIRGLRAANHLLPELASLCNQCRNHVKSQGHTNFLFLSFSCSQKSS